MAYQPYLRGLGKRCSHCQILRPEDAFWKAHSKSDGYHSMCKICYEQPERKRRRAERRRQKWQSDHERLTAYHAAWRQRNRRKSNGASLRHYWRDPQKRRDGMMKFRHSKEGKLKNMIDCFNKYSGRKVDKEAAFNYWLKRYAYLKRWKAWKESGYQISLGPILVYKKKGEPDVTKFRIGIKRDELIERGKRVIQIRLSRGTDAASLKLRRMQKAEANK